MSSFDDFEAMTVWFNDNDVQAKFTILKDNGKFSTVVVKPNESITIPSKYDGAIRREVNGVIVAGACPWLKKRGEESVPQLHSTLDYKSIVEDAELTELAAKINKNDSLAKARAVKAARKQEVK